MGLARNLALILVAGCASPPTGWTHPTKDSSDWKSELAECERFFGSSEREQARCMTGKGWKPAKSR